jgi:hypothetical protein
MSDRTGDFYALSDSVHGYGAELQVGNGASPEVFYSIAGLRSITPGDATTADIDITHLRSPDAHREHRPGIRDHGPFSVTGVYLPGDESQSEAGGGSGAFSAGGLYYFWKNRTTKNFKVVFNDGSPNNEFTFTGYVSQFQIGEIGIDDVVTFTASFMPTESYDTP